ncbi:hypothetical protein GQ43DRAFT_476010 [Delitschia confertaspora ATCC 74209]|uniref:Uncharacterized protein n=1 Tax=Delitschia confertaspora ATCC 74209 TaxID=1513339 RepID=A0A9P4MNA5_9PLEO|nr:hypothetical protein GQ43DRAFT_476010 [Delitschia confertaspora ATCC 74209]
MARDGHITATPLVVDKRARRRKIGLSRVHADPTATPATGKTTVPTMHRYSRSPKHNADADFGLHHSQNGPATVGIKQSQSALLSQSNTYLAHVIIKFINKVLQEYQGRVLSQQLIGQISQNLAEILGISLSQQGNETYLSDTEVEDFNFSSETSCDDEDDNGDDGGMALAQYPAKSSKHSIQALKSDQFSTLTETSHHEPQRRKRSPSLADRYCGSDTEEDDFDLVAEVAEENPKSFRTDDKAGIEEYVKFLLSQFTGVLLKDIVLRWVSVMRDTGGKWLEPYQKKTTEGIQVQRPPPEQWPEGVEQIGPPHLKKSKNVLLATRILLAFFYFPDEVFVRNWIVKLEKSIESYLHSDAAKFSSSSKTGDTFLKNKDLALQVMPELFGILKSVEDYEANRRDPEPQDLAPETVTCRRYKAPKISKKRKSNELKQRSKITQKERALQQRAKTPPPRSAKRISKKCTSESTRPAVERRDSPEPKQLDDSSSSFDSKVVTQTVPFTEHNTNYSFSSSCASFESDPYDSQSMGHTFNQMPGLEGACGFVEGQYSRQFWSPDMASYHEFSVPCVPDFQTTSTADCPPLESPVMTDMSNLTVHDPSQTKISIPHGIPLHHSDMHTAGFFTAPPQGGLTNNLSSEFSRYTTSAGYERSRFYETAPTLSDLPLDASGSCWSHAS